MKFLYDELQGLIEWLLIYLNVYKIGHIFQTSTKLSTPLLAPKNRLLDIDYIIERTIASC